MIEVQNLFTCDLKNADRSPACRERFYYSPQGDNNRGKVQGMPMAPPAWDAPTTSRLSEVVAITHSLTGHTTFYCCADHAAKALEKRQHLAPLPSGLTEAATDADVKAAAAGAKAVTEMRGPKPS